MNPLSIFLFAFAAMIFFAAFLLCRGQTGWVKSFDWVKVKDKKEYARFLGRATAATGIPVILCAVSNLFLPPLVSIAVLLVGLAAVLVLISRKAKNHYR